jgi:hypothetical protein
MSHNPMGLHGLLQGQLIRLGCEDAAYDKAQWWAMVNTEMKASGSLNGRDFLNWLLLASNNCMNE